MQKIDSVVSWIALTSRQPLSKIRNGHTMSSRIRAVRGNEPNRFSPTHTLSDYPLLIGEIIRRSERRSEKRARFRSLMQKMRFSI
jgi:hypothetical protein